MAEKEDIAKHLEFVLDVIERMARNSFLLKGWSITLVAAVFLLAIRGAQPALAMIAGLPLAITFWGLDAYYLRQERMYRALYNHVRKATPDPMDRFNLDARPFKLSVDSWIKSLISPPVFWFHASVFLLAITALALFSLRTCYDA